jgi:hypothetical protein
VHAIQRLESGASRPNRGTTERLIGALTLGEKGEALFKIAGQPAPRRVQPRAPSAATLGAMTRSNVPISASRFVARAGEIERVRELVRESRLLTISGSGGCGKTRLALEVARELEGGFSDGVWLVELAPLADAALVAQTIAATVGIRDEPGRAVLDVLTDYLRSRQLLLILDNCEHLIDACAQVVDTRPGDLVQFVPAAALLARVDRARSQRDALPDTRRTGAHDGVGDGDDQPFVGGHPRRRHPTMQPRTTPAARGYFARVTREGLDGGILAQAAGEVVQCHLDPRARRHGGDDSAHDRAIEGFAGGHQRVAQAEAFVQLGRVAAGGQAKRGFAPIVAHSPIPGGFRVGQASGE